MKNKEYLLSLDGEDIVDWIIHSAPKIMARYTNKEKGLAQWLEAPYANVKEWFEIPLVDLGLEPAIYKTLYDFGIRNVGELADMSKNTLVHLKGVGKKNIEYLSEILFNICGRSFPP